MKRPLSLPLIALLALLIAIVGVGGVLAYSVRNGNTSNTSLYLTGTRVIPTVAISTSTAYCVPKLVPGQYGGVGIPAIKPHLCAIPTFTEQDVHDYMNNIKSFSGLRIQQVSSHFTVTRILFVTNRVANDILNAETGVPGDDMVVCYVEVYGDFTVASPFSSNRNPPILHHGQIVFDGTTGNQLGMGVAP